MITGYFTLFLLFIGSVIASNSHRPTRPFYTNSNHIIELTAANFDDYVFGSNYTTIVEYYAPWCGYCQQFRPEFEKASKKGHNYAQFAAINCDELNNKQFCAKQNVKGFPTILEYRPPKTFVEGKPRKQQFVTQKYENERSASRLVDTLKGSVKLHSSKLPLSKLESFLSIKENDKPRVLFFSDKRQISPIYKSLSIDFFSVFDFSHMIVKKDQDENKIKEFIPEHNGEFPSLVLIHPIEGVVVFEEEELTKSSVSKFLADFQKPVEGPLSDRHRIITGIKSGKYKNFKDYHKQQKKKAQQEAKRKANNESTLKKDEL